MSLKYEPASEPLHISVICRRSSSSGVAVGEGEVSVLFSGFRVDDWVLFLGFRVYVFRIKRFFF